MALPPMRLTGPGPIRPVEKKVDSPLNIIVTLPVQTGVMVKGIVPPRQTVIDRDNISGQVTILEQNGKYWAEIKIARPFAHSNHRLPLTRTDSKHAIGFIDETKGQLRIMYRMGRWDLEYKGIPFGGANYNFRGNIQSDKAPPSVKVSTYEFGSGL